MQWQISGETMDVVGEMREETGSGQFGKDFGLWGLLDQTRSAIARSRELELARCGLTLPQSSVLFTLYHAGGMVTLGEISERTMRRHHSVSTLIKRMAERGLVETTAKQPDDNKKRVIISPKGRGLFEKATASSIEIIFSALSTEEKQALKQYLLQLQEKARSLLGTDYRPPLLP
jgi:DNA-binding MarR family transcriptional regulator